jgi:hypothetical protein
VYAAVPLQSSSNRIRSKVADLVVVLQKLMLALTHGDEKENAKSANKEQPQNSSYKP